MFNVSEIQFAWEGNKQTNESVHVKKVLIRYTNSEDSGELVHQSLHFLLTKYREPAESSNKEMDIWAHLLAGHKHLKDHNLN